MELKKTILVFVILLLCPIITIAQDASKVLTGRVFVENGDKLEPMPGTIVCWLNTNDGGISSVGGVFSIKRHAKIDSLEFSFTGYKSKVVKVTTDMNNIEVILEVDALIKVDDIKVQNRRGTAISKIDMAKKEMISFAGLCKMACCNLAESFENSASVTVGFTDAVSGARQIQMLGYAGTYTQMLDESRPIMRGLASPYGLSFVPGMWLQGIQISKGITSVASGYEALTGQINLEHRKPTDDEPLFVNLYLSDELMAEGNISSSFNVTDKLSTVILGHAAIDKKPMDHNNDGFLDLPNREHYNFANRWLYKATSGVQIRAGIRLLSEDRKGGQMDFDLDKHKGGTDQYGFGILNRNFNAYVKVGIPILENKLQPEEEGYEDETTSSFAVVADYTYHEIGSFFGIKNYDASQDAVLANILYQINYGKKHKLITGVSFTGDNYREDLVDRYILDGVEGSKPMNFDREEYTVGAFGEYTYNFMDKLSLVAGVRVDHNNDYGLMFSPRGQVKWNILPNTVFRVSGGIGYRNSTLIADNMGMLATGRQIVIAPDIDRMERGVTYGGSLTQSFTLSNGSAGSVNFDYFRSGFTNQVVVDQELNSNQINFYNLDGRSYTNTYQFDFTIEPFDRFVATTTFRYNDTKMDMQKQGLVERPLISRFKGLINLQYATNYDKWMFDFTAQINGSARLPSQTGIITNGEYEDSPVYPMFFAQVTKKFRKVDLYLGCENIANYTQDEPILSANDPFSTEFNSSVVWGPITGRKFYVGMRYTF